jgi:mono/diheme cytochrome c family protein
MLRATLIFSLIFFLGACGNIAASPPTLDPLAAQGKQLFSQNCATCHSLEPNKTIVGPTLAGIASRAGTRIPDTDARAYIEQSILEPGAYIVPGFPNGMPSDFGKKLSGDDFNAIVAFLLTLK